MFDDLVGGLGNWILWRLGKKLGDRQFLRRWGVFLYIALALTTITLVLVYGFATSFNAFSVVAMIAASGALTLGGWTLHRKRR